MSFQSSHNSLAKQYISICEFQKNNTFGVWFQFKVIKKFNSIKTQKNHEFMPISVMDINNDLIKLNLWNKDIPKYEKALSVNKMFEVQNFCFNKQYQTISFCKNVKLKGIKYFTVLHRNKLCVQNKKRFVNISNVDQLAITNFFERKLIQNNPKKISKNKENSKESIVTNKNVIKYSSFCKSDLQKFLQSNTK